MEKLWIIIQDDHVLVPIRSAVSVQDWALVISSITEMLPPSPLSLLSLSDPSDVRGRLVELVLLLSIAEFFRGCHLSAFQHLEHYRLHVEQLPPDSALSPNLLELAVPLPSYKDIYPLLWCFAHRCTEAATFPPSSSPSPSPSPLLLPSVIETHFHFERILYENYSSSSTITSSSSSSSTSSSSSSTSSSSSSISSCSPPLLITDISLFAPLLPLLPPASLASGLGIFAHRPLAQRAPLLAELPLLALYKPGSLPDAAASTCHLCLRHLPPSARLPCPRQCAAVRFCSPSCAAQADARFHQQLCGALLRPEQRAALASLEELAERTTWRVLIVLRVLAMMAASPRSNPFAHFEAPSWRRVDIYDPQTRQTEAEAFRLQHPGLDFGEFKEFILSEALPLLHAVFPHSERWLGMPLLDSLFGLIDANMTDLEVEIPAAQQGKHQPRQNSAKHRNKHKQRSNQSMAQQQLNDHLKRQSAAPRLVKASGLFTIHSKFNHSCSPTAKVISGFPYAGIQVVALQEIPASNQIYLSYCDPTLPKAVRSRLLKCNYLFECQCKLCQ